MQNSKPLVTIIALCYNQSSFVIETLESITNQSYSNLQLIIIDDASLDDSCYKIECWKNSHTLNCQLIKHKKNQGICKSLNEGLTYTKGKYFQVIACDDILLPDKTERQVKILNNSSEGVAAVFSDAYLMQENGFPHYGWFIQMHRDFIEIPSGNIYNELLLGNFIPAMAFLAKTEVVKQIGGYDEKLNFEDYDLWLRLAQHFEFVFDTIPSVKYRIHTQNLHKKINNWHQQYYYIYRKHIDYNPTALILIYSTIIDLYKNGQLTKEIINDILHNNKIESELRLALRLKLKPHNYTRLKRLIHWFQ